eukprot:6157457-Heterocapsa_arctica.AAC.1
MQFFDRHPSPMSASLVSFPSASCGTHVRVCGTSLWSITLYMFSTLASTSRGSCAAGAGPSCLILYNIFTFAMDQFAAICAAGAALGFDLIRR